MSASFLETRTKVQNFIPNKLYFCGEIFLEILKRSNSFQFLQNWKEFKRTSAGINQKKQRPRFLSPNLCSFLTLISYFSTELHGFLLPPCTPARVSCRASWVSYFLLHPYYYLLCLLVKIDVQISELYGGIVLRER